ncbi:MAG: aldehyde dehydrogenase family protein, partial [Actinobacteria bacterium]|nr:aldehyde dehydrogenase family protein [Actinomycetota bacterium]
SIYMDALEAFAAVADSIQVGPGEDAQMGPLITRPQYERVSRLVAEALAGGARAVAGGAPVDGPGFYFPPTVIADADVDAELVAEEQFGPVLPILPYDDVEEAVARANGTMYGLCGSVWGADGERAQAVAERLECGVAYVNAHGELLPQMPFGGAKWSGIGVENGADGLLEYTERQLVFRGKG